MYCPNCGRENIESAKFCTVCGNSLGNNNNNENKVINKEVNSDNNKIEKEKTNVSNNDKKIYTNESLTSKVSFSLVIFMAIAVVIICLFFAFLTGPAWITFMFIILPFAIIYAIIHCLRDPSISFKCPKCNKQWDTNLSKVERAPYGNFKVKCSYCFSENILDFDNHTVVVEENKNDNN